jgi:hypothetical protein
MKCAALTSAISQLSCRRSVEDEKVPAEVVVKTNIRGEVIFPNMGDALPATKPGMKNARIQPSHPCSGLPRRP